MHTAQPRPGTATPASARPARAAHGDGRRHMGVEEIGHGVKGFERVVNSSACVETILVMEAWVAPRPLARVWCLYEALLTVLAAWRARGSMRPTIGLPPVEAVALVAAVEGDGGRVQRVLGVVDAEAVEVTMAADKVAIFAAVARLLPRALLPTAVTRATRRPATRRSRRCTDDRPVPQPCGQAGCRGRQGGREAVQPGPNRRRSSRPARRWRRHLRSGRKPHRRAPSAASHLGRDGVPVRRRRRGGRLARVRSASRRSAHLVMRRQPFFSVSFSSVSKKCAWAAASHRLPSLSAARTGSCSGASSRPAAGRLACTQPGSASRGNCCPAARRPPIRRAARATRPCSPSA
jgi:hypothetical protein